MEISGILVVDKPIGPTSFDVVKQVRYALKADKAGHTGTLDPLATGVLPVCLGEATKIAQFITERDKAYDAVVKLGAETDTLDAQGKVTAEKPVPPLDAALLEATLAKFRGPQLQTPPMYSAVKVGGKRLYELARAGEEVERAARPVTVHALTLVDFTADELTIHVECSKGFFVRTLAQELGRSLGCGAHLKALRRTRSGVFSLARAVPLQTIVSSGALAPQQLVTVEDALAELPSVSLNAADTDKARHGGRVEVAATGGPLRVLGAGGELLAIADVEQGRLKYRRVLSPAK
jgi:tRNA pseudouridine55 synthase